MKTIFTHNYKLAFDPQNVGRIESLPTPPTMAGHLSHLLTNYYYIHFSKKWKDEAPLNDIPSSHYVDFHGGNQSGAIEMKQWQTNKEKLLNYFNSGEDDNSGVLIAWQDWYGIAGKLTDHLPREKIAAKVKEVFEKYKSQLNGQFKHDILFLSHGPPIKELTAWVHKELVALSSHTDGLPG